MIMMGKFDSEFLLVRSIRSIGQENLELNYDRDRDRAITGNACFWEAKFANGGGGP